MSGCLLPESRNGGIAVGMGEKVEQIHAMTTQLMSMVSRVLERMDSLETRMDGLEIEMTHMRTDVYDRLDIQRS